MLVLDLQYCRKGQQRLAQDQRLVFRHRLRFDGRQASATVRRKRGTDALLPIPATDRHWVKRSDRRPSLADFPLAPTS
jgi:hypothetical protein